jgi:hypothetical protein
MKVCVQLASSGSRPKAAATSCGWRQHQHAPAAEREPDQKQQTDEDAEQSHLKGSDINSCGHSGARL